ncbi:uncharacterized protein LOC116250946 [Nymphaea colorata]|nr:uncharacterized protein LOC116250946 [Nymphaea colorata]
MEDIHMHQFPAFGDWDMNGNMPITQYFESARQAGLQRKLPADEPVWDLYAPVPTIYRFKGSGRVKRVQNVTETWKQGRVCHVATSPIPAPVRAPKAVDEDLYKIPSELLRKNRRRRLKLLSFISSMFRRRRICY